MSKMLKLKNMLAEAFYYDVGIEKNQFESAVADATEKSTRKFESSMKEKVLNQKVKIRASKGQPGQPVKYYIIDKVADASIDWYWKQYVVVFKDEKGKEYFLKPGFKVEVLSAAGQPDVNTQAPKEPAAPQAQKPQEPSPVAPGTKQASKPASGAPTKPMSPAAPAPNQKAPVAEADVESDDSSYKTLVAEIIGGAIWEFLIPEKKRSDDIVKEALPYIKSAKNYAGPVGKLDGVWDVEIPIKDLNPNIDERDLKLSIMDELENSGLKRRSYSGLVDIQRIGRLYIISVNYYSRTDE